MTATVRCAGGCGRELAACRAGEVCVCCKLEEFERRRKEAGWPPDPSAKAALEARNHAKFQARLRASDEAREYVAELFRALGYYVRVPETRVARTYDERAQYRDRGDIYVALRQEHVDLVTRRTWGVRVEVKRLGKDKRGVPTDFDLVLGWRYRQKFIVASCTSVDERRGPEPAAYLILSQNMREHGAALVYYATKEKEHPLGPWYVENVTDGGLEEWTRPTYFAPLKAVEWGSPQLLVRELAGSIFAP